MAKHRAGSAALDEGRLDEALEALLEVWSDGLRVASLAFDIALAYKFRRDWPEAVRWNREASRLEPTMVEAHWNRGVAATAIRDWPTAMEAWRALGFDVGPGPEPGADYGATPVRLDPEGHAEVVWGIRIDPCRARLVSVPLPESGHRWGDIVLHDVVPAGSRMLDDVERSVFDELLRMDPSPHPTHEVRVEASSEADVVALQVAFEDAGLGAEDWTQSIELLCAQCSRSGPHPHADGELVEPARTPVRRFAAAGPTEAVERVLAQWAAAGDDRRHEDVHVVG